MYDESIFIAISKKKGSNRIIAMILRDYIYNQNFFKKTGIKKISKKYKICDKTLKKYLKDYIVAIWWGTEPNKKRIKINAKLFYFLRDLEKIKIKYDWHLTEKQKELWKIYLNNIE